MALEPCRFVAFDLDGTLIDSRRDLADAANVTLAASGHPPLPVDAITSMVGEGAGILLARAFAAHGAEVPDGALEIFLHAYDRQLVLHTTVYEGVRESLAALAVRMPLAVLTNKPRGPAVALLEHFDLAKYLFRVVGGDGPLPRKPDPAGLLSLMAEAGAGPGQTTLVGDSWVDLETARRAGSRACLVRYGFGFAQVPVERLRGDEHLVDTARELASL